MSLQHLLICTVNSDLQLSLIRSSAPKLAGAAILGVGVWSAVDSSSFLGVLDTVEDLPQEVSQLIYVSYLLIALGSVLLIIGFLGCCGAIRESRCMLLTVRPGGGGGVGGFTKPVLTSVLPPTHTHTHTHTHLCSSSSSC